VINWISISIPYPSLEFWTLYLCLGSVSLMVVTIRSAWVTGGKSKFLKVNVFEQFYTVMISWIIWPLCVYYLWDLLTRKNHDQYADDI